MRTTRDRRSSTEPRTEKEGNSGGHLAGGGEGGGDGGDGGEGDGGVNMQMHCLVEEHEPELPPP